MAMSKLDREVERKLSRKANERLALAIETQCVRTAELTEVLKAQVNAINALITTLARK